MRGVSKTFRYKEKDVHTVKFTYGRIAICYIYYEQRFLSTLFRNGILQFYCEGRVSLLKYTKKKWNMVLRKTKDRRHPFNDDKNAILVLYPDGLNRQHDKEYQDIIEILKQCGK